MIIIGIDPGSRHTGYGIIRKHGHQLEHIASGVIHVAGSSVNSRLPIIFTQLQQVIAQYQPEQFVIEQAFLADNAQTALKLGMARGVAILAGSLAGLPVFELSARQAKKFVTGSGAAKKEQVNRMVCKILRLQHQPELDASDALAIAISHAKTIKSITNIATSAAKLIDQRTAKRLEVNQQNLARLQAQKEAQHASQDATSPTLTGQDTDNSIRVDHNVIGSCMSTFLGNTTSNLINNGTATNIDVSGSDNINCSNDLSCSNAQCHNQLDYNYDDGVLDLSTRIARMHQELKQLQVDITSNTYYSQHDTCFEPTMVSAVGQSETTNLTVAQPTVDQQVAITSSSSHDRQTQSQDATISRETLSNRTVAIYQDTSSASSLVTVNSNTATTAAVPSDPQGQLAQANQLALNSSHHSVINTTLLSESSYASTSSFNSSCSNHSDAVLTLPETTTNLSIADTVVQLQQQLRQVIAENDVASQATGNDNLSMSHITKMPSCTTTTITQHAIATPTATTTTSVNLNAIKEHNLTDVTTKVTRNSIALVYSSHNTNSSLTPIMNTTAISSSLEQKLSAVLQQSLAISPTTKLATPELVLSQVTSTIVAGTTCASINTSTSNQNGISNSTRIPISTTTSLITSPRARLPELQLSTTKDTTTPNPALDVSHLVNFKINSKRFNMKTGKATNRSHLEQKIKQTLDSKVSNKLKNS